MSLFKRLQVLAEATGKKAVQDFTEKTLKDRCLGHIDGVAICDISLDQVSPEAFLQLTREAMALIQSLDPRRYRRICRHLDYIVNMELISSGNFDRKLKICHVDFAKFFTSSHHEWNLRCYACLLIHEATHGVLEEKLILYDKEKRERIEALCHREEYRFALHFEPGWAEDNIGPFKPERWKLYWEGTGYDRLKVYWKRFTEDRPSN